MKYLWNLYLSLYPFEYERRSDFFYRVSVLYPVFFLLSIIFGILFYTDESAYPRIFYFALPAALLPGFLHLFAQGLDAGAFGEKLRRYGKKVWKAALITNPVIGLPSTLIVCYIFFSDLPRTGATIALFGVFLLALLVWVISDARKRYRSLRTRTDNE